MVTLDVRGLSDDQIEFLQQLIKLMRQNHQELATPPVDETDTICLHCWHLGVEEEISHEEIYDYPDV